MQPISKTTVPCQICQQTFRIDEVVPAEMVRGGVIETIRKERPDWSTQGFICLDDLARYRAKHVENVLETERGELSALEQDVVRNLAEHEILAANIDAQFDRQLNFGDRLSDSIAVFGGSWGFILAFMGVIVIWIAINTGILLKRPFDPFPYILLNLILSCLAAIQAPIIMMSQNRQEAKDRMRGEHDYRVDLKAELEVRNLNAKMDLLLTHQWQRLLEIQSIQMEMMEELMHRRTVTDSDDGPAASPPKG